MPRQSPRTGKSQGRTPGTGCSRMCGPNGYPDQITLADVGGLVDIKAASSSLSSPRCATPSCGAPTGPTSGVASCCGFRPDAEDLPGPGRGRRAGARFATVGLHHVLDMWLGNSESSCTALRDGPSEHAMRALLRRVGRHRAFADQSGTQCGPQCGRTAAGRARRGGALQRGIFVIGATNQPWDVNPALRRPGRFDRTMLILPPDAPLEPRSRYPLRDSLGDVDFEALARESEGLSGADLPLVCDEAANSAGRGHRQFVGPPITAGATTAKR